MGEIADDILGDMYESMGSDEGFDGEEWEPRTVTEYKRMNVEVLRETDKAWLARTAEYGDTWMPKSKVRMSKDRTTASVPDWLEARWHFDKTNRKAEDAKKHAVPPGRRKPEPKGPRPMTVVRYREDLPEDMLRTYTKTHGMTDMGFLFVGEILNRPGHGLFINMYNDKMIAGLHIDSFRETAEDET